VTGAQLKRTVEILGLFGLDQVYSEAAMPNVSGAVALMQSGTDLVADAQSLNSLE
jgi:hypothetical protein